MKEDYLWDKSGEPDPEIRELENLLAPLRYQPKPLELPVVALRRNYLPLAIAATVLIALLISGVWLRLRRGTTVQPPEQAKSVPSVVQEEEEEAPTPEIANNTDLPKKTPRKRVNTHTFTKHEREEALAAKEQVMLALRLTSEKLKLAQRRTRS